MNAGAFLNAVALAVCAFAYTRRASRAGLESHVALEVALLGVCGALVGARVGAALVSGTPIHLGDALRGGAGAMSWGAYAGGLFAATLRLRGQVWRRHLDAAAPAVLAGIAIARIGCFVNGDDFGVPCAHAWCHRFPPHTEAFNAHVARGWIAADAGRSLSVHPLQLYLALGAAAAACAVLAFERTRARRAGSTALFAASLYFASRMPLEQLRDRGASSQAPRRFSSSVRIHVAGEASIL